MRILIAYYSRTGKTEKICRLLYEELKKRGHQVELFKLEPKRDYSVPLINPRAYKDTFSEKCDLKEIPRGEYDLVVFASPIWYDHVTAPVMEGAKRLKEVVKRAIAITTSARNKPYHEVFSEKLQKLGYEVLGSFGFLNVDKKRIKEIADLISSSS